MIELLEDGIFNICNVKSWIWIYCIYIYEYIYLVYVYVVNEWKVYDEISV